MSTPQSGPADPHGQPTDTGEFLSQQGVVLGWVAAIEQIMDRLRQYYIPECPVGSNERRPTVWTRGGVPGKPFVTTSNDPLAQPNYFIGEQYMAINYAPQSLVFARAPVPIPNAPTPRAGYTRSGYKQISNAIYTIQTRIWAFDDDDGAELFNYVCAAAYREVSGSNQGPGWDNLVYAPKKEQGRGTVMDFALKIGIPVFMPPLTPQCVAQINQEAKICLPTS
jgi:hypothetical protein